MDLTWCEYFSLGKSIILVLSTLSVDVSGCVNIFVLACQKTIDLKCFVLAKNVQSWKQHCLWSYAKKEKGKMAKDTCSLFSPKTNSSVSSLLTENTTRVLRTENDVVECRNESGVKVWWLCWGQGSSFGCSYCTCILNQINWLLVGQANSQPRVDHFSSPLPFSAFLFSKWGGSALIVICRGRMLPLFLLIWGERATI